MKSAIVILTYRRVNSLRLLLGQVEDQCPDAKIAVFEDCGQTDDTEAFLLENSTFLRRDMVYEADVYERRGVQIYLAHSNVGVTGNSNKAIRWFMEQKDVDHLCLCNDDLEVTGPFHQLYSYSHNLTGIGLFCFTDFTSEAYKCVPVKFRGIKIKMMQRMTGIMMSMTRALVNAIGYYDADSFVFGQEHVDYTHRARLAGFIKLNGHPQHCLDICCDSLKHQEVPSSLTDDEKRNYNATADIMIDEVAKTYAVADWYRPFSTGKWSMTVGGRDGVGTPLDSLNRYSRVKDSQLDTQIPPSYAHPTVNSPAEPV